MFYTANKLLPLPLLKDFWATLKLQTIQCPCSAIYRNWRNTNHGVVFCEFAYNTHIYILDILQNSCRNSSLPIHYLNNV